MGERALVVRGLISHKRRKERSHSRPRGHIKGKKEGSTQEKNPVTKSRTTKPHQHRQRLRTRGPVLQTTARERNQNKPVRRWRKKPSARPKRRKEGQQKAARSIGGEANVQRALSPSDPDGNDDVSVSPLIPSLRGQTNVLRRPGGLPVEEGERVADDDRQEAGPLVSRALK